ncbi:hypothetical protein GWK18_05525 [Kocuria sp. JC486]|uniref:Uncharacterized protein n=1 Tax=Kocuria soli TaxID=2485125 RepID=A0A3N3ZTK2_9MICC|nr:MULTISPECIES: hypothetical protein [Kocuria]NHU85059.1 hypothetical protein [Kocuria sp. JC486]ROZ65648.1 hypothetical protein EDL96_00690 [Kocuria soli]
MTDRALRLLRGWIAAFTATTAAVLAHTVAGGQWPSAMLMLLCICVSAPLCMLLAGVRIPLIGLSLAVGVSQALFHGLLALSGGYVTAVDRTGHAGHLHSDASVGPDLVLVPAATDGAAPMMSHAGHTGATLSDSALSSASGLHGLAAGGTGMLAMHLAAAVLTVLVLRHGEKGVLAVLAALLVRAAQLVLAAVIPPATARPWKPGFIAPVPARVLSLVRSGLRYRGPPMTVALA